MENEDIFIVFFVHIKQLATPDSVHNVITRKMIIIMRGEPSLMASGVTVLNI